MASLLRGFAEAVDRHSHRTAVLLEDRRLSYRQLARRGRAIADAIVDSGLSRQPLVGLLCAHGLTVYSGVVGILGAGRGVVPIDPGDPPARIYATIRHAELDTVVVGPDAVDRLEVLLSRVDRPLSIIAPETGPLRGVAARHRRHRYTTEIDLDDDGPPLLIDDIRPSSVAYLLYTSGTTNAPRAVAITHRQARAYLKVARRRFSLEAGERCSHTFPPHFDLSIHDLFCTWTQGATLVPWPRRNDVNPAMFINRHRLTRWASVPAVAMAMEKMGELAPNRFPGLRTTLFGGEALPVSVARAWQMAAPNSSIINMYGPTEATIAVASHHVRPGQQPIRSRRSTVCLGRLFNDHRAIVVDGDGRPVDAGQPGELLVTGPQLADGYWGAEEATARRFVRPADRRGLWFRTGDRVERDRQGRLYFLGRLDHRIKVRGHHVDLGEVDHALRGACGHSMACVVGWPRTDTRVDGLVGFVAVDDDETLDEPRLLAGCRRVLPAPVVPDRIIGLRRLPTNGCGKLDRRAMQRLLEQREV